MVSAFEPSPVAGYTPIWDSIKQGQDYANSVFQLAQKKNQYQASLNAGQKFAGGDLSGAASAQAQGGDIQGAEETQNFGAQRFMIEHQYLGQAATVLQGVYDQHGGGQQGTQAVVSAFGQLAPDLKQFGMSDQQISQLGASLAQDTQGALKAASAFAAKQPTITKDDAGNLIVTDQFGNLMHSITGEKKPVQLQPGEIYHQFANPNAPQGSGAGSSLPASGSAPPVASPQGAPGGDALFGNAQIDPAAVRLQESGGNPNAVSPAGAIGTMQTVPATLQKPGYGVQPAQNNSPQELDRVGTQYLGAMQGIEKSPTLALAAQNWGPGNVQKWIAAGGDVSKLPAETKDFILRTAFNQALGRGAPAPAAAPQGAVQTRRNPDGSTDLINTTPAYRDATPEERAQGIGQVTAKGENKYLPSQAAIATMPDSALDFAVKQYFLTGKVPAGLGRSGIGAVKFWSRANELAQQSGQSVADIVGTQNARQANVAALNTMVKMKAQVDQYSGTLDNNISLLEKAIPAGAATSAPIINRWIQAGRQSIQGDPDVTRLNILVGAVKNETAKLLSGAMGAQGITDSARRQSDDFFSNASTPQQFYAAIDTIRGETSGRRASLNNTIGDLNRQLRQSSAGGSQTPTPQPQRRNTGNGSPRGNFNYTYKNGKLYDQSGKVVAQ